MDFHGLKVGGTLEMGLSNGVRVSIMLLKNNNTMINIILAFEPLIALINK
jgi:hypothetical protein